jgi:pseudaminic acid cytidylyltransferase
MRIRLFEADGRRILSIAGVQMTSRLAIVPARGGSKRIPDKNIREFFGQPMIAHILNAARASNLFDVIHVSTDSTRISDAVTKAGFAPHFPRPDNLADDHTPLMPVLRYVTERFLEGGDRFDEIWLLMACSPLIDADDLRDASKLFAAGGGKHPVISVTSYPAPIEWAFSRDASGRLTALQPGMFSKRSQDLEKRYYDTGSFCIFPTENVLQSAGAGDDSGFIGYFVPRDKAIDIDTEDDWRLAEIAFQLRGTQ